MAADSACIHKRKRLQIPPCLPITTIRSRPPCIWMPSSGDLELACYKIQNQSTLHIRLSKMPTKVYVAVIELEVLAVAWTMEKFHHILYASYFLLETDQKPLEAILSKSVNQATPRLQRLLIRTFAYTFTVKYIPGSTNQLADFLSQLGGQKDKSSYPSYICTKLQIIYKPRSDSLNEMRIAMQEDDELVLLKHTITYGWPSTIREVSSEIQAYWTFRQELTVEDGIVFREPG